MLKCRKCGHEDNTADAERKVWCAKCRFFWFASKADVGEKPRTLKTTHEAITGATRRQVLFRCGGKCELCGRRGPLHVGHLVSVEAGHKYGLTDSEINHPENLCGMCEECNSNVRAEVVELRVAIVMIRDRINSEMRTDGLQQSTGGTDSPATMDVVGGSAGEQSPDSMHGPPGEVQ